MRDFTARQLCMGRFSYFKSGSDTCKCYPFCGALSSCCQVLKTLKHRNNWILLPWDFKTAVDEVGERNFQEEFPDKALDESQKTSMISGEYLLFLVIKRFFGLYPFEGDVKIRISGEYVCLEAESYERSFRAVRPFAFRVLPFNETVLQEKLLARFGAGGQ